VGEQAYPSSVKSVRLYLRRRFPRPKLRPFRRVATPAGAQAQVDWPDHRIDIGELGGPTLLHAFHPILMSMLCTDAKKFRRIFHDCKRLPVMTLCPHSRGQ